MIALAFGFGLIGVGIWAHQKEMKVVGVIAIVTGIAIYIFVIGALAPLAEG